MFMKGAEKIVNDRRPSGSQLSSEIRQDLESDLRTPESGNLL